MTSPPDRLPASALGLLVFLTLIWGLGWPAVKLGVAEIPVFSFRVIAGLPAAGLIFLFGWMQGVSFRVPPGRRRALFLAALFNLALMPFFVSLGATLIGAGQVSVVAYTMPLWAFLIAIPVLGERPSPGHWLGLAMGLGAITLLATGGGVERYAEAPLGVALVLCGSVSWAAGTIVVKRVEWNMPHPALVGWQMLIGSCLLMLGAVWEIPDLGPVSARAVGATVFLILLPMVLGFWAWFRLVSLVPAGVASLSVIAVPVVGMTSGALLLGEEIGWREGAALVLVVGALATVMPRPGGGS